MERQARGHRGSGCGGTSATAPIAKTPTAPAPVEEPKSPAMVFLQSVPADDAPKLPEAAQPQRRLKDPQNWLLFGSIVILPVLLVAAYLMFVATPLYEARSVIAITKTGNSGSGVQAGLLGGWRNPATCKRCSARTPISTVRH